MSKQINNIADLTPDTGNANAGTQRGRYMVESSLRETGAGRSIVVDREGRIIAGNKTLEAWAEIDGEIEIVKTDGRRLVVVQREDLDLDDAEGLARKLSYYDNRAGEVGLDWDAEQVMADISAGVQLDGMFFKNEMDAILQEFSGGLESAFLDGFIDNGEDTEKEAPDDGFENPYVGLTFPSTVEQRDYIMSVVTTAKEKFSLTNSADALLEICRSFMNAQGDNDGDS